MSHYNPLAELIWAKIALTQKSQPAKVHTDRRTFDGFLAAHGVEATHILGDAPDSAAEIIWLTEKLTWKTYCESGSFRSSSCCHVGCRTIIPFTRIPLHKY
jgi:hypothetical protein